MKNLRRLSVRRPCMFCGKELRAKYPYYRIRKKENAWKSPKTIGRICEDCLKKIRACEHNSELR